LLQGPAGIGKTAFVKQLANLAVCAKSSERSVVHVDNAQSAYSKAAIILTIISHALKSRLAVDLIRGCYLKKVKLALLSYHGAKVIDSFHAAH